MSTNNRKGPIVDPGQCRCCGATKKCRVINVEYEWIGQKEIYSDMFMDTFSLLLSNLDGEVEGRLICATCVCRLRDASSFRRQVLCCEELLLQAQLAPECEQPEIKQESTDLDSKDEITSAAPVDDQGDSGDHSAPEDIHTPEDDNTEIIKETPQKPVKKLKRIKSKTKQARPKKVIIKKKSKKQCMMEMMEEQMDMDEMPLDIPAKPRPKPSEAELQSQHNIVTIVESSYVCPFDSSFSDYLCVYCRASFSDADALRTHTHAHDPAAYGRIARNKRAQIDISRLHCRLCQTPIHDLEQLKQHLTTHGKTIYPVKDEFLKFKLSNNELKCTECNNSFSFFHALKKHMAEHFGTCICDICGAHYFEERMLILHQKSHQKIDECYPCAECGKNFKSKHSRYLHEARTHKKEPAYQCPKCDEVLFSYSLRYRHMIQVHGERRTYQCAHCERSYDSRKSLREHNRRYHLKIFKHQCDLCDKRFYIPSRLKEHLATHSGERNYRCDLCGKSYPRLRGLKVHLQSHNSEKKFRCVLCSASFTQNVNLKNHVKKQHQGLDLEDSFRE